MNRKIAIAIALALASSAAIAGPTELTDQALDAITAGGDENVQGSGGAVVGNNSEATLVLTGTLDLSGEAQSGARALNAVNSSESTVANGVNVWDGTLPEGAEQGATGTFDVTQENSVKQEQRRVALLPRYERSDFNESSTWTEDSSSASAATLLTSTESFDVETTESTRDLTFSGTVDSVSEIVGQTIQGGRGIAGAGDLQVNFAAGEVDFRATAAAGEDAVLEGELRLIITLPTLDVDFAGGGCAVQMGSCTGEGNLIETDSTLSDNSVIETTESSEESTESFVGDGTRELRSPFVLADAQAEYIVVDDSTIDVESNYGVALTGTAQADMRALNAVNAAGSAVANAVNISRTPSLTATASLSLVQSNVINHSR